MDTHVHTSVAMGWGLFSVLTDDAYQGPEGIRALKPKPLTGPDHVAVSIFTARGD